MGSTIYGNNLFEDVMRYAMRAGDIAKKETFDVIHAHDWLSFPAGIEAKRVTGKPLVVHVHATEFDRGGGSINEEVYKVEKAGMEEADRVVTVSDLRKS
jgi:glycogen synthase